MKIFPKYSKFCFFQTLVMLSASSELSFQLFSFQISQNITQYARPSSNTILLPELYYFSTLHPKHFFKASKKSLIKATWIALSGIIN